MNCIRNWFRGLLEALAEIRREQAATEAMGKARARMMESNFLPVKRNAK